MAITKKKIETFQVEFKEEKDRLFENLITSSEIVGKEIRVKGKDLSFRILSQSNETIVGLVETSRNNNIPPKRNKRKKIISKIGLDESEGLVYANVFIYEKKRKILMYEVNKFGCYVDHFVDYLYRCGKGHKKFGLFNISLNPVLKGNEYQRMLKMKFYKSLELNIANPTQLIEDHVHQNDALIQVCSSAASIGSTKVSAKYEVAAKGATTGLTAKSLKSLVDSALTFFRGPKGENITKIQVVGYETDSEDNKLQPIDLIADRYLRFIELNEPRENSDLLEGQRNSQINELYEKCVLDFDTIFGK